MFRVSVRLSAGLLSVWLISLAIVLGLSQQIGAATMETILPGEALCSLPCWAGLRVGERIDTEEVAATLRSVLPEPRYIQFYADGSFYFTAGRDANHIEGSALIRYDPADTLWGLELRRDLALMTLLQRLGAPACYTAVPSPMGPLPIGVVLHWKADGLSLSSILMGDPAQALTRGLNTHDLRITLDDACQRPNALPWFGFGPIWAY